MFLFFLRRCRVISFRVPDDLYEEFDRKCQGEEVSQTIKLRELVDGACHEKIEESNVDAKPLVNVIHIEDDVLEKVVTTDSKRKSWFPLDSSPLFGKRGDG